MIKLVISDYEFVPGIQTANFELPYAIDLENLSQFFRKRKMKTKIRKNQLCANSKHTYIHVSRDGRVKVHSFNRIRYNYLCKRIAGFKAVENV